ncbi:hypothetical protein D9M68_996800 [compost metagenome]
MGVASYQVVAVVNLDHVAVGSVVLLHHHHATGGRQDRRAHIGRKVQPGVQGRTAGDRIDAEAKRRPDPDTVHGLFGRYQRLPDFLIE